MRDFGLNDLLWTLGSILCVSIIGMLWTQRDSIGRIVADHWRESLEKARQQKAAREQLYGYVDLSQRQRQGDFQQRKFAQSVNRFSPRRPEDAWYAGDDHMSSAAESPVRTTLEPVEPVVVRGHTHQPEPDEPPVREPAYEPAQMRRLPKHDLIVLLAVQRDDEGKYVYSSNDITKFIGGTAADVKALISAVRDEQPADQVARLNHLSRPIGGWNKAT